ncbi:cytochrome c oxidase subunit 3 family protein [Geobacter pickeringii]|uniref:Cytochrome C oxidase subunit III n=1 Tax=Geobacter pickeringii TaxID=345632 RepID=A0A0B5BIU8_9BACT|nr:cytochrome c oxidase subunit 3 family protein [Geobacter pickeringii]AJE04390.1 cytochrome C oxidase subunit III [Geobacter pickeringii]
MKGGAEESREERSYALDTARLGIWCFLATEVLLFGGLFTTYTVFRLRYPDLFHTEHLKLNRLLGAANTVILITSSLTMALAVAAARQGRRKRLRLFLLCTIVLAASFLGVKYLEWSDDFSRHLYPKTNLFFSLYFTMTGLHGIHVMAGMGVLGWLLARTRKGHFARASRTPVEIGGLYWHFVDLVWIYLFPLLYLVG